MTGSVSLVSGGHNSLGGAISLWLARHHPDRVASLVLLNAAAARWRVPSLLFKTQKPWLSPLYRLVFRRAVVQRALRTFAYRQLVLDETFMDAFMAPIQQPGTMRAALAIAQNQSSIVQAWLSSGHLRKVETSLWNQWSERRFQAAIVQPFVVVALLDKTSPESE